MRIVMRGTIAHILLEDDVKEDTKVFEIIQDILTLPREKFYLEAHLDEQNKVVSIILFDIGLNFGKILEILDYAARKYEKSNDQKFNTLAISLYQINQKIRTQKPLSPKNLFRLDIE